MNFKYVQLVYQTSPVLTFIDYSGARPSSMVEHLLMGSWVRSIPHGVDPLSYSLYRAVLHDWCNNGLVCAILSGMVHIKDPLLLIGKSSP